MVHVPPNALRRFIFIALAVAAGLAASAWPPSDSRADDPYSEELVQVDIGERGYAVPRNFLAYVTRDPDDGSDRTAVLLALWPGFEPRTPENDRFWQRRHPAEQIRILISQSGLEGFQQLQNVLRTADQSRNLFDLVGEPAAHGLLEYARFYGDGRSDRYFVVADATYQTLVGNPVVFDCGDHTTDRAKELFDVEFLCSAEYELRDGAWLKFDFFMINLENWREIDTGVRRLIDSFMR